MWERWTRRGLLALSVATCGFLGYLLITRSNIGLLVAMVSRQWVPTRRIQDFTLKGILFNGKCRQNRLDSFEKDSRAVLNRVQVTALRTSRSKN